jgi:hypothetical protein
MMLADEQELGGTMKMSREDGQAIREQRQADRRETVDRLLRSIRTWRGRLGG